MSSTSISLNIRSAWGVFRDRRPNLYSPIKTLDGSLES